MSIVDLVYDEACPNVNAARANLMRAFSRAGALPRWTEHRIGSAEAPARVRGFGSPSILVDGADVAGLAAGAEDCCRVYERGGAPDVALIAAALERALHGVDTTVAAEAENQPRPRSWWRSTAAVLPGIGVALMPKVLCSLCWPPCAGVLSAAGLTFLMEDRWLLPISVLALGAAVAALAWRARSRRGYGPLALGALAAGGIVGGKFVLDSTSVVYAGVAVLVAACAWNAWPRLVVEPSCSACRTPEVR